MTRFEIFECECGHDFVRERARPNVLPCGKCGGREWRATQLMTGDSRLVAATV